MVNGPKTWSLAAALHPEIAAAYDAAQDRAAGEIIGWLAEHATTRVGPRGRQVQVPVEQLEAAVVRHYTSRAGDPHRHLHLQVNARVFAAGRWRGLHSVGVVDCIEALNGIGHAAVMCDPRVPGRARRARLHPRPRHRGGRPARAVRRERSAPGPRRSAATSTATRPQWRRDHPGQEPGPRLRRGWDRRAWAQARPDKVVPIDGAALAGRGSRSCTSSGSPPPVPPSPGTTAARRALGSGTPVGRVNREPCAELALVRLGARRSAWNTADIRGEVERIVASSWTWSPTRGAPSELAEDLTARAVDACVPLLDRGDVPEHVRVLTSREVLAVEADLVDRLAARADHPARPGAGRAAMIARRDLDHAQRLVVAALAGTGSLVVVEGAAGAGKTTTLAAARELLDVQDRRLVVVTPTLKAARVATDGDRRRRLLRRLAGLPARLPLGRRRRLDPPPPPTRGPLLPPARDPTRVRARLLPGDLLLVDEAGMLDQDTARALLTIADETGARIAFVGDRHQLPAVGRGGVLDHAARAATRERTSPWRPCTGSPTPTTPTSPCSMRTGQHPGEVFDALLHRGLIAVHPSDVERHAALTDIATQHAGTGETADGVRIIADTRDQVAALSAAIRDQRLQTGQTSPTSAGRVATTSSGEPIGIGDRVTTRRNDRDLGVANRDRWTVTGIDDDGALHVRGPGRRGERSPAGRTTCVSMWSWPTPPPCTASRARPSTTPTCSSARPPAPPRRTSR